MSLQVCQLKNTYAKPCLHLVRKKFWGPHSESKLITLQIQLWCEDKPIDRTPTKYHSIELAPYDKEAHKKKLCEECVAMVKKTVHSRP